MLDFSNLSVVEYLQNFWCYADPWYRENEKINECFLINSELMAKTWPKEFSNINFDLSRIRKQGEFFHPGAPADEKNFIENL